MISRRFKLHIYLRALILILTIVLFSYVLIIEKLYITSLVFIGFIALQVYSMIRYVTQTNRSVSRFIDSIRQRDFTITFSPAQKDGSFRDMSRSFNAIVDTFRNINAEKEAKHIYLQTVVENIPAGILSFDQSGEVELINEKTKKMFDAPYIKNIRSLNRFSEELVHLFFDIGKGEKKLFRLRIKDEVLHLSISSVILTLNDKEIKILTLTDIKKELDVQEVEAWQKLIRVLTHEIMNSLSPITSLSSSMVPLLESDGKIRDPEKILTDDVADIHSGLKTITKRGEGLMDFVQSYRSLTKIPQPEFRETSVGELLKHIEDLMSVECQQKGVKFNINIINNFKSLIDEKLIEQVIINLVKNASDAFIDTDDPVITISSVHKGSRDVISVRDNGMGIPWEDLDKVFIPFFSTKTKGSGIGLSLSKQIMQLHNGKIEIFSELGKGTEVILSF